MTYVGASDTPSPHDGQADTLEPVTQILPLAPADTPRVVIVDEDRRVQQSLSDLLGLTGRVEIVGRAGDVRSALETVERERPDVVIVDPRLPDLEAGAALVSSLERSRPALRIVLSGWSATPEQPELLSTACSYVSKNGTPEDFISAMLDACCGGSGAPGPDGR
jgi:two-component system, NarL family, nitrate/nitrite response regulator NarL